MTFVLVLDFLFFYLIVQKTPHSIYRNNTTKRSCEPMECLRSSPDRSRSRRQSPSPTRGSVPQPRTPRTPRSPRTVRRQRRLRCRNAGCSDHFVREDTRLRHELHRCRYRNDDDQVKLLKYFFKLNLCNSVMSVHQL